MPIRKLVLDVLKPTRGSSIVDLADALSSIKGVTQVVITVNEMDVETVTLEVTIEGSSIDYDNVREVVEKLGGIIHSIGQVVAASSQ